MKPKPNGYKTKDFVKGVPITLWLLLLVIIPLLFTFIMSFYTSDGNVIDKTFSLFSRALSKSCSNR